MKIDKRGNKHNKRLAILSHEEIDFYFSLPSFSDTERSHYFSLSEVEYKINQTLSSATQWYFILQLGYFKAKKQFFIFQYSQIKIDAEFIQKIYQCDLSRKKISEDTHRKIRHMILTHLKYSDDIPTIKSFLINKAQGIVSDTVDPKSIFRLLYDHTEMSSFIIPQYSTFQTIISTALKQESLRLHNTLQKMLPQYAVNTLDKLLNVENQYYEITAVKKDQKSFKYKEVQKIITHKINYDRLYHLSNIIIPKLNISKNMVSYYSSLASHYPISKLKKLPKFTTYLYLLSYISLRIKKFNDNLMSSFVYYVDRYEKSAKEYGKECVYESKLQLNRDIKTKVPKVMRLVIGEPTDDKTIQEKALAIAPKNRLIQLIDYIAHEKMDENCFRWEHYDHIQAEITKNLRPIFMSLDFTCGSPCNQLDKAIVFLKTQFEKQKPLSKIKINKFPITFVPKNVTDYIYSVEKQNHISDIKHTRYEFAVYSQIRNQFKNNHVTICDSINHKSLTEDLIPQHQCTSVIKKLGNPLLSTPCRITLSKMEERLDQYYYEVNKRIENGKNKSVRIDQSGTEKRIVLKYEKKDELVNHQFFKNLLKVSIIDVLNFVQKKTGFLNCFIHIKPHCAKAKKDNQYIVGDIIANAIGQGIGGMSNRSNLDYQMLYNAEHNFIRLDTLKPACDTISNGISRLPVFSHWAIEHEKIYVAVDGQKLLTRFDILLARNSKKYFPLKKGVVGYSLLANFIPLSVETISPNLHESYFLFDILKNCTADIKFDCVTGDSHAINPVNFLLMRYLPIEFAPHLVHINQKIENLYSFSHPNKFNDLLIRPHYQAKTGLILLEEENINWVIASLLHGDTRQNIIVRKLSSLSQHNRTCQAMMEYNRIFESIYTLKYIDDQKLRQYVRASQNRIEAYHQLRRAIAFAGGSELRGGSELEVMIWNECARLVANAIIYYNAYLLTKLLKKYEKLGDKETVEMIKRISPIAWVHINFMGNFIFSFDPPDIDIESMIAGAKLF
jgi:TnpA family transposase